MSRPGRAAAPVFIPGACLTLPFFRTMKLRGDRDDDDRAA